MSKSISDIEQEIVEEFSLFDDWMDKYQYIIEMGQSLPTIPDTHKTEDNIVHGCQSQVWLLADDQNGQIHYQADSDAVITKGLIALLIRVLSNHPAEDILKTDMGFVDRIGIRDHLSPNRSNGLNAMIKQMKIYALAYQAKAQQNK
ncbi:MAG: SufE family protein [Bacteroidota bacterium]